MKIFSIRNMLGAAAAYGAYRYAQNHGGFRQAFDDIVGKVREAAREHEGSIRQAVEQTIGSKREESSGVEAGGERGELENVSDVTVSEVTSGYSPSGG